MAKLSVDDILDGIKQLSIVEAAELSKKIEEEFGIQAAAPMMAGAMAGGGGAAPAEEEAEEKTEFDVILGSAGDKKIQVIKEVRARRTPASSPPPRPHSRCRRGRSGWPRNPRPPGSPG